MSFTESVRLTSASSGIVGNVISAPAGEVTDSGKSQGEEHKNAKYTIFAAS